VTSPSRLSLILCPLLCLLPAVLAQESDAPAQTPAPLPLPNILSGLGGLFGIELPRLEPPGTYKLIFHPHFGDFFHRSYIRTDVGLSWSLNDHFGIDAEADTYATHGLHSGNNYGYGLGQVLSGVKYVFKEWPKPEFQTSIGFTTALPVDHPPVDMTDGLRHYTPNVAIQYRPPTHPRWTVFAASSVDFVNTTEVKGYTALNTPRDNSLSFTGGAIYDMGQLKWTLQGTYTTTALIGERTQNFYSVVPSVLWYVPMRYANFTKTQWIVSLGVNSTWGPDGFYVTTSSRVRAEITFKQVMQKLHDATTSMHK